jgi:hypothetical protein
VTVSGSGDSPGDDRPNLRKCRASLGRLRSFALLAVFLAFLGLASSGSAGPRTTNPGGYHTVRVVVTDKGLTVSPTHAPRGSTAIFLLSNRGRTPRVLAVGDASLTHRRGTGFAVKLARNQQKRVLLYLTYRGLLPVSIAGAGKAKVQGVFRVT